MRVLIVSADGFEDSELLAPLYRLREAQVDVDLASPGGAGIRGKHGYEIEVDRSLEDAAVDAYDMLLLPGGKAPARLRESASMLELARAFFARGKPVAAICHGPQILAAAGLLEGRSATAYKSVQRELDAAGAHTRDEAVVVDGNLITSREPEDLPAFNRAIVRRLGVA